MKLVKEPLVHFLILGGLLFVLYVALNRPDSSRADVILVGGGQVQTLAANFAKVWQRAPSTDELKGLIDAHVKEEMLSREAVKLGLDRHDPVIRRRLQQKMEFLLEDFESMAEPTDEELTEFLANHPEKFQQDARFSFRQVYLNAEDRKDTIESDLQELLQRLRADGAGADLEGVGDRILLPDEFVKEPWAAVSAQFGRAFVEALEGVPVGEWTGPVPSGYGQHLVYLSERTEARLPALEEVRTRVERNLAAARREQAEQRFLDELLKRYTVTIEWPDEEVIRALEPPPSVNRP